MCEYIITEDFSIDKYIFDESNSLWYERQGDYYIPCLALPAEEEQFVGPWGKGIFKAVVKGKYEILTFLSQLLPKRMLNEDIICRPSEHPSNFIPKSGKALCELPEKAIDFALDKQYNLSIYLVILNSQAKVRGSEYGQSVCAAI